MTATRPNILFMFSDQQRWDSCGCYGQPLPTTPNLDGMAADGVLFEQAYTCQPVCGPARAALQTGKYPAMLGCPTNHRRLPPDAWTLAAGMREAGYEAGYIGKWHLASFGERGGPDDFRIRPVPPDRRGGYRDYWIAADALESTSHSYDGHMFDADGRRIEMSGDRYRADWQTDLVLDYLRTRTRERPWFLFLSYIEPHHQNDHNRFEGPHGSRERWGGTTVPGDLEGTEGDWRENYPDYLGCVASLDANLGRIREELDALKMADDTLIVYTSDHGCHFRTRNGEYKRSCHDACTHIPLVIHGPGFRGGRRVEEIVSLIDLPPSVLTAGGAAVPEDLHGRAVQPLMRGAAQDWPREAYLQISESHNGRAIRDRRWTYSVRAAEGAKVDPETRCSEVYVEDCLYDNDADPFQRNNRAGDPTLEEVRRGLRKRLLARMRMAGEPGSEILPAGADGADATE